jgi:hypothetical protein
VAALSKLPVDESEVVLMLTETVIRRLEALGTISQQGKRINGLFRLMEDPILWYEAYANIYANDGAIAKGVDNTTLDGFAKERVLSIIARLKDGTYHFKPVRRTYILKANGKMSSTRLHRHYTRVIEGIFSRANCSAHC